MYMIILIMTDLSSIIGSQLVLPGKLFHPEIGIFFITCRITRFWSQRREPGFLSHVSGMERSSLARLILKRIYCTTHSDILLMSLIFTITITVTITIISTSLVWIIISKTFLV